MSSRRSPWQIDTARLLRTFTLCLGLFVYFFFAGDNRSVCLAADPLERLISTNQAISWSGQPLAAGLVQLSQEFGVTIWLDRRVDPTTKIEMQANASRLEVLQLIAQRADATVVIAAPLVIIARPEHADRLASSVFATRQIVQATPALRGLLNNKRFAWELLSTPQEILQAAEKAWGVRVPAESLPHDQWRAATFTSIDGATILALVGGGFNRTIAVRNNALTWSELPDRVAITKAYAAPQDPSAVREEVLRVDSQAVWKIDRNKIQLQATAAAHQVVWIATLAPAKAIAKSNPASSSTKLGVYQNTEIRNRAARDVIDYIAKAEQWTVEYQVANEAPQLAKLVSFKLAKANAEELIAEVCRQADLRWTRSGTQVVIAPQ